MRLIASHGRLIGFGFVFALVSSFGQTFFIGIFGPSLQEQFGLSHTGWSGVYMLGTLASAAVLPWTGKLIDTVNLRRYALAVLALMIVAAAVTAGTVFVAMLVFAIFLLRHSGQGLASHVAVTTMARYFSADRGRAIAVSSLGFSLGEATLPIAAVGLIGWVGWRWTYGGIAILVAVLFVPLISFLARGHSPSGEQTVITDEGNQGRDNPTGRSWTRREVLGDPRFYLLLPALLGPALIITALFFHHLALADAKGWSSEWIAGNYVMYAASTTLVALFCGPVIDRIGGMRIVPLMLVPLAAGVLALSFFDHKLIVWAYFVLIGVSIGIAHTAVAAMWAELYGVEHLGAIRSMATALAVFASALGPIVLGALIDSGVAADRAVLVFVAYCAVATVLMLIALGRRFRPNELSC